MRQSKIRAWQLALLCGLSMLAACDPEAGAGADATAECPDVSCDADPCGCGEPDGTPCDDGRPCTVGDVCKAGACVAGAQTCPCEPGLLDCALDTADAVNLCRGAPICMPQPAGAPTLYACVANPAGFSVCDASVDTACVRNACDPATGNCAPTPSERTIERCDLPNDACRIERLPASAPSAAAQSCDDGLPCSTGDHCAEGACIAGDSSPCACKTDADCTDDGDLCNGTPFCDKTGATWTCATNPASVVACDTSTDTACLPTACDPATGQCGKSEAAEGTACDDGVDCTKGDVCDGKGTCTSGAWTCCKTDADCAPFEDGDACNGTLFCDKSDGSCVLNPATVVVCPTVNDTVCVQSTCQPLSGLCLPTPVSAKAVACDDGNPCTVGEVCDKGSCHASANANTCSCSTDADCFAKDDGDLCNGTLFCNLASGLCQPNPATVVHCQSVDDTACAKKTCAPKTGLCALTPVADGTACDADGTACTEGDACKSGLCTAGKETCPCQTDADCGPSEDGNLCNGTLFCDLSGKTPTCRVNPATVITCTGDGSPCTTAACLPKTGNCVALPTAAGVPCDAGVPGTIGDSCDGKGACVAGAPACTCKTAADCASLDDADACTVAIACKDCVCTIGGAIDCDDGDGCTVDSCDATTGCSHEDALHAVVTGSAGSDSGVAVAALPGGAIVLAGNVTGQAPFGAGAPIGGADGWVLELDVTGKPLWSRVMGGTDSDIPRALTVDAQQGVVMAGGTASTDLVGGGASAGGNDVWMVRLDASGSQSWSFAVGGTGADTAYAVVSDGSGFIALGSTKSADLKGAPLAGTGEDAVAVRVDAAGKQSWIARYGGTGNDLARAAVAVPGGFVAVGATTSTDLPGKQSTAGGQDVWLFRGDDSGAMLWNRSYGGSGADYGYGVAAIPGGGYAVAARSNSPSLPGNAAPAGDVDGWIVRVDPAGDLLWSRTFGGTEYDLFSAITARPDGTIFVAGWTSSTKLPGGAGAAGSYDTLLASYDANGALRWSKVRGGTESDSLNAISATAGGVVAVGSTASTDLPGKPPIAGASDFWVQQVDAFGNASCSESGGCASKAAADCDDANPCTLDLCDKNGCSHPAITDGTPCGDAATCSSGTCK
ncbi:MAG: RHS repeat protein [Deltaproteobacteria bacterium]|nr:RHS repeat protein [Deltaproteobacteria bacterium]